MNLQEKLFRLKSMKGLQDTEENHDDSELKVGFKKSTLTVTIIQSYDTLLIILTINTLHLNL